MIYTVTLNPALDRTVVVDTLVPNETVRTRVEKTYAGGKGIDVSRVLRALGETSVALGFCGGYEGLELEGHLLNSGIIIHLTRVGGSTRVNFIINEQAGGRQFLIGALGPEITAAELGQFFQTFRSISNPTYVIISGSIPRGVDAGIYAQLVLTAHEKGALVALDSDGEPLRLGLQSIPDFIKPNQFELERLVKKEIRTEREVLQAARSIHESGVKYVIVSRGSKGLIIVSKEGTFKAVPPKLKVDNTVGAGDSTLAGFILAHSQGKSIIECARLGCAAGVATVSTPGTALCTKELIDRFLSRVKILEVKGNV
jgi:6-phosphofructokinase 2